MIAARLRFATGVCIVAACLLIGSAWAAIAVAHADSSNAAAHADVGIDSSGHGSTTVSGPVRGVTKAVQTDMHRRARIHSLQASSAANDRIPHRRHLRLSSRQRPLMKCHSLSQRLAGAAGSCRSRRACRRPPRSILLFGRPLMSPDVTPVTGRPLDKVPRASGVFSLLDARRRTR